jgi:carnitine O-acetyltransferase
VPALFSDSVFLRSSNWVLSTSAVFSKHFPVYGWGEVCPTPRRSYSFLTSPAGRPRRVRSRVYDGLRWCIDPHIFSKLTIDSETDRLQYTITSRKESPNAEFCEEIARAAEDLYALHESSGKPKL